MESPRPFTSPKSYGSRCESGDQRVDMLGIQHFVWFYKKPTAFFIGTG